MSRCYYNHLQYYLPFLEPVPNLRSIILAGEELPIPKNRKRRNVNKKPPKGCKPSGGYIFIR